MSRNYGLKQAAVAALAAVVLLRAGCTGESAAPQTSAEPAPTTPPGTVARAKVGDQLTLTASVERVITDTAFAVRDVDLTNGTLLVLSTAASPPSPPQLVTVQGTVIRFSHPELTDRYRLGPQAPYRAFEGGRALVAREITVW
ncbi:hypothetical protein [Micromonospora halophytica]|uniref:Uncharacterized protein n=1 Tax=Micromonospora halophytica TaxID=47864 RepID=A0A1C5IQG9_9ACTN|nr:hypothetical protein [Micromonospora halophytica]SCG60249.1 hypothetical protein GA0070560_114131 [Micromonospora halophytica]